MKKDVIIVENFYQDPDKVVDYALNELKVNHYFPYGMDTWRATKTKKASECPFKSSRDLIEKLNYITGEEIDLKSWSLDYPEHNSVEDKSPGQNHQDWNGKILKSSKWNCVFHVKPKINQKIGEGVHNHVTDIWNGVGKNGWVGLVYLNPKAPIDSGLFLWKNKLKEKNLDWMSPSSNWDLIDSFGSVFNRLILCRGAAPHSGADGFTNTTDRGRLYQTFFFTTKPNSFKEEKSVSINI